MVHGKGFAECVDEEVICFERELSNGRNVVNGLSLFKVGVQSMSRRLIGNEKHIHTAGCMMSLMFDHFSSRCPVWSFKSVWLSRRWVSTLFQSSWEACFTLLIPGMVVVVGCVEDDFM